MRRTQALRKAPLEAGRLRWLPTSEEFQQETQTRDRARQAARETPLATKASAVSALTTHPVRSRRTHSGASKSAKLRSAGRNWPSRLAAIPDLAIPIRIASRMPANKAIAQVLRECAVVGVMRQSAYKRTG